MLTYSYTFDHVDEANYDIGWLLQESLRHFAEMEGYSRLRHVFDLIRRTCTSSTPLPAEVWRCVDMAFCPLGCFAENWLENELAEITFERYLPHEVVALVVSVYFYKRKYTPE